MSYYKQYAKELLNIAMPIIMGNLGFILIGAGDVLIAGRHATTTLAAIAIATAISNCITTFGVGLIASASPVISNYRGAKKPAKRYFYPTIRFAMICGFFIMLAVLACVPSIDILGFESELVPVVKQYMVISAFATFGGYLHVAVKDYLQAFEIVLFPNLVTIFAVFLNLALNVLFVFGWGIIPSMGAVGLAISSFIVRYFMGFVLLIYAHKIMKFRDYRETNNYFKSLVKVGLPISFAILIEFVAFNSIAIFMGRVSGVYAAAQNLVCTLTTVTFMIPFAISNAIAVKVGFANGAKNIIDMKRYIFVGITLGLAVMLTGSIIYASFPQVLVSIFTTDNLLINISIPVVYVIAFYQIFDGLQVSLAGIFKGIKKTKIVMVANFIGYWLISIPLGYTLAFKYDMKLIGFWIGIAIASVILCSIMGAILNKYIKRMQREWPAPKISA